MGGDASWPHCGVVFISKENEGFGSAGLQAAAEAGAAEVLAAAAVTGAFFCSKMKSSGCCQPALGRAAGGLDGPGCRAFTTKGLGLQLEPVGCPRRWDGATVVAGAAWPTGGLVVCFWCWKMEIWHVTDQPRAAHVAPRPSCGCRDLLLSLQAPCAVRCEPRAYSRVSLMASIWALTLVGTAWKTSGENSSVVVALDWTFWYLKFKQERGEQGEKKLYLVHVMIRRKYFGAMKHFLLLLKSMRENGVLTEFF